jgi:transposase-like protein
MSRGTIDQPEKIGSPNGRKGDHISETLFLPSCSSDRSKGLRSTLFKDGKTQKPYFAASSNPQSKRVSIQNCLSDDSSGICKISHSIMDLTEFNFEDLSRLAAFDSRFKDLGADQSNLQFNPDNYLAENSSENLTSTNSAMAVRLSRSKENSGAEIDDAGTIYKQLKPLQTRSKNRTKIQFSISTQDKSINEEETASGCKETKKRASTRIKTNRACKARTRNKDIDLRAKHELIELEKAIDQVFSDDDILPASIIKNDTIKKDSKPPRKKIKLVRAPEVKEDLPYVGTGLKIDFDESYLDPKEESLLNKPEKENDNNTYGNINSKITPNIVKEAVSFDKNISLEIAATPINFVEYLNIGNSEKVADLAQTQLENNKKSNKKSKKVNIEFMKSSDDMRPQMKKPDFTERDAVKKKSWTSDVDEAVRDLMGNLGEFNDVTFGAMASAWQKGYESYFNRSLNEIKCPYVWIDERVMNESDNVISKKFISVFGVDLSGRKRLLSFVEKVSGNKDFWRNLIGDLEIRGLANPRLFIADCDSSLWKHLATIFPRAEMQYCWNSVLAKIRQKMPNETYKIARQYLDNIRKAEDVESAFDMIEEFKSAFGEKYPVAVTEILKYRQGLFTYIKYPVKHRISIKSVSFVKKHFPPENLMAAALKSLKFEPLAVYMIFNYIIRFEKDWMRFQSKSLLRKVQRGKRFDKIKHVRVKAKPEKVKADSYFLAPSIKILNNFMLSVRNFMKSSWLISTIYKTGKSRLGISANNKAEIDGLKMIPKTDELENSLIKKWQEKRSSGSVETKSKSPVHRPLNKKRWNLKNDRGSHNLPRPLSGLERELINDLNLEKKAFSL